jgi:hypothetical protein
VLSAEALDRRPSVVDLLARLAVSWPVRAAVDANVALEVALVREALQTASTCYEFRADSLIRAIERQRDRRPIQTSLFDRREEQRSQLREDAVDGWLQNLHRLRDSARAMQTVLHAAPHLVAAWIE